MSSIVDQSTSADDGVEDSAITAAELSEKDAPQTGSVARAYFQLLKPRVMTLVVFTAAVGLWLAPGEIEAWRVALGLLILAVGAGASGALNMWYDRDIDALMSRTAKRPIPNGDVGPNAALVYGLALSIGSVIALGLVTNWVAAGILAFTNAFYVVIYTMWLKRRTAQNIVIGGAAGAFPPMIGWAMVSGDISWVGFVLFGLIFLWTPPHFWALALVKESEYGAVKVPMLPNVVGAQETKRQIVIYTAAMSLIGLVPFVLGAAGYIYFVVALAFGGLFMVNAWQLLRGDSLAPAKRMFGFSIFYLFLLFGLLLVDARSHVSLTWL